MVIISVKLSKKTPKKKQKQKTTIKQTNKNKQNINKHCSSLNVMEQTQNVDFLTLTYICVTLTFGK
jgi:hypothetical protein